MYGIISSIIIRLLWAIFLYCIYKLGVILTLITYTYHLSRPLGLCSYEDVQKVLKLAKRISLPWIYNKIKKDINEYLISVDGRTI